MCVWRGRKRRRGWGDKERREGGEWEREGRDCCCNGKRRERKTLISLSLSLSLSIYLHQPASFIRRVSLDAKRPFTSSLTSLPLPLSHIHSLAFIHTISHSLSNTFFHIHSHAISHTLSHSLSPPHSLSLSPSSHLLFDSLTLQQAKVSPNSLTVTTSESPLHYAARRGSLPVASALVLAGTLR